MTTDFLLEWIKERIVSNQNCLIIVSGHVGHGKSWFCGRLIEQLLALKIGLKFPMDGSHIIYWTDDLLNLIENSNKYIILIDESTHEYSRRKWFSFENNILTLINATQRFRQNVMIIITQNKRLISSTAWFMADFYVKTKRYIKLHGKLLKEPAFKAKIGYNYDNVWADKDPKFPGDTTVIIDPINPPSDPMQKLLDNRAMEFKKDLIVKIKKMREEFKLGTIREEGWIPSQEVDPRLLG